ncbi:hypothetical protein [Pendulispora albinea]|uniref:Lipoprotein n=1 Tax=Pendulispora albinea TaxID=2741071 RepID=A0ABZ2LUF4_9BACT
MSAHPPRIDRGRARAQTRGSFLAMSATVIVLGAACSSGTGGRAIRFSMGVAPAPESVSTFVTTTGWSVTLEEACMAIGPIYLYANPSLLAPAEASLLAPAETTHRRGPLGRVADWLVPPAFAHGGDAHYNGGEVRGEWVEQVAFDALAPAGIDLGATNGLAGPARSFSLLLLPPRPTARGDTACLRGHHAYARGAARKGETTVPFEGGLDIENKGTFRSVDGIPLDAQLDDGVRITVRLHTRAWFDDAHFDRLTERNADGRFVITAESQVAAAWFAGARAYKTFSADMTRGGEPR